MASELLEDLLDVGHVEVATHAEVLGLPVVAAQERVHIGEAALARGGIAQVAHVQVARKGQMVARETGVGKLLGRVVAQLLVHDTEDIGHGVLALRPLAEHILITRLRLELHGRHAGALLPRLCCFSIIR